MTTSLAKALSPEIIHLDQLLLDPNNPRFSELGEEQNLVPETRFADEKVQSHAFNTMRSETFDVAELKDTIKTVGFLPMDRIVVRLWKQSSKDRQLYVVVEGNRRVAALKWLMDLQGKGKETFNEDQLKNFTELECLVLDESIASPEATLILPGLRHVSGIKQWGPYQKAKAIYGLRKAGYSPQEAAQSLGLSTRAANQAYRSFLSLEQMKANEEYGEYTEPNMYSYFEEVLKRPNVRAWLSWSDETERFTNTNNLQEFYSWMVSQGEENPTPKLPEAKSIRELSEFIDDPNALNAFRAPDGTISRAQTTYAIDHPEDWYPRINAATSAIRGLTPDILRGMGDDGIQAIMDLRDRIDKALEDRKKLLG